MSAKHQRSAALVLFVDDEPHAVQMLELLLEQNGYRTKSAGDGKAALMSAIEDTPDLILVDAKMPDVDGFETKLTPQEWAVMRTHCALGAGILDFGCSPYTRPYKPPIDHETSVKIISRGDGSTMPEHFDPAVLACFLAQTNRFEAIYERYADV